MEAVDQDKWVISRSSPEPSTYMSRPFSFITKSQPRCLGTTSWWAERCYFCLLRSVGWHSQAEGHDVAVLLPRSSALWWQRLPDSQYNAGMQHTWIWILVPSWSCSLGFLMCKTGCSLAWKGKWSPRWLRRDALGYFVFKCGPQLLQQKWAWCS